MVTILHEIGMLFRSAPASRRGIARRGKTSYTSPGSRACDPISSASRGTLSHAVRSESVRSESPSFASPQENIDMDRDARTHVCGRMPRFHGDAIRSDDGDDEDGDDDDDDGDDGDNKKGVVAAPKLMAPAVIGGGGLGGAADEGEGAGGEGGTGVARGEEFVRGRRRRNEEDVVPDGGHVAGAD
ncbi:unnamed protein product [Closterium sp. Yama58-4]|nr:unnamed protein product [Closterium sp. Yama58-4]